MESTSNEMSQGHLNTEIPRMQGHDGSSLLTNDMSMVKELLQCGTVDVNYRGEDKNNILHEACFSDNVDIVDYIISNTAIHIDSRGQYGRSPVMFAAENGNKKVFDFLVQRGCDLTLEDEHKNNILHVACFNDNVDIVDYIISNTNIHIDSRGQNGETPVMFASVNENRKVFDFLVQKDCDLTVANEDKNNMLHVACFGGNIDIVDYIISNSTFHIDSRGKNGATPVMIAAEKGNRKVFDFLVQKGCDLTVANEDKNNMLHVACFSDNVDIVDYSRGQCAETPVMFTAQNGKRKVFDFLVERGCDLSLEDEYKNNILHFACFGGNVDIVDYISINTTIRIDSRGQNGRTPIMAAAQNGNRKVFDFLVQKGCDLFLEDEDKNNILHCACFSDNVDIVDYILSNTTIHIDSRGENERTPGMFAAQKGNRKVFDFLVQRGCDLTVEDECKNNVLHVACFGGNVDIVDYIITNSTIHIDSRGQYGRTPIMAAAQNGNRKVFDFLIQKGCDLTVEDECKKHILHVACFGGNVDIVDNILSNTTFHIDRKDRDGCTPVMAAAYSGNRKVFDFLVQKGCDLSEVDHVGNTVLHFAACGGDSHIIQYILLNTKGVVYTRNNFCKSAAGIARRKNHFKVVSLLEEYSP